jgi:hypothetical protein
MRMLVLVLEGRCLFEGPEPEPEDKVDRNLRNLFLPNPGLKQSLPEVKKPTELKWTDMNFSSVSVHFPIIPRTNLFCRRNIARFIQNIISRVILVRRLLFLTVER